MFCSGLASASAVWCNNPASVIAQYPGYMHTACGRTVRACFTSLREFRVAVPALHGVLTAIQQQAAHDLHASRRQIHCSASAGDLKPASDAAIPHSAASLSRPAPPRGLVLGIESSCDDTGVAILTPEGHIVGQALATQADVHAPWGGVVPTLAKEAHQAAIDATVGAALADANITAADLAAVAVTVGPGLSMCLHVGVQKAREVAAANRLPIIGVHHMEAHAVMARAAAACAPGQEPPAFPFLALLVSGGHNLLLVVRGIGDYQILGATVDDAVGEAFDKVARLLGLAAHGAALEALALEGDVMRFPFPRPMIRHPNCDFSYAGLKNAARLAIEKHAPGPATEDNRQARADLAAGFQHAAVQHLKDRCKRATTWAIETCPDIKSMVVSGGVACNRSVQAALQEVAEAASMRLVVPPLALCTDNGAMIAWAGQERLALGLFCPPPSLDSIQDVDALYEARGGWLRLRPRWPLTEERHPRAVHRVKHHGLRMKRLHPSLVDLTSAALAGRDISTWDAAAAQGLPADGAGTVLDSGAAASNDGGGNRLPIDSANPDFSGGDTPLSTARTTASHVSADSISAAAVR